MGMDDVVHCSSPWAGVRSLKNRRQCNTHCVASDATAAVRFVSCLTDRAAATRRWGQQHGSGRQVDSHSLK